MTKIFAGIIIGIMMSGCGFAERKAVSEHFPPIQSQSSVNGVYEASSKTTDGILINVHLWKELSQTSDQITLLDSDLVKIKHLDGKDYKITLMRDGVNICTEIVQFKFHDGYLAGRSKNSCKSISVGLFGWSNKRTWVTLDEKNRLVSYSFINGVVYFLIIPLGGGGGPMAKNN